MWQFAASWENPSRPPMSPENRGHASDKRLPISNNKFSMTNFQSRSPKFLNITSPTDVIQKLKGALLTVS
jgi:hypothetical protein